jgi:hypothetical protein
MPRKSMMPKAISPVLRILLGENIQPRSPDVVVL